jgi:thioredoxin reductase (NADPH)
MEIHKLVIIGSGPAGLTAAIYAARGGLSPVVVAGRVEGGQLMLTTDVDDFPGFPDGIQGPDLIANMRAQAVKFGTQFIAEDVTSVDFSQSILQIQTETQLIQTKSVIVATGASAIWLGLESEQRLIGRGVSSCAVCDGPFFTGKKVAVVGGGDAAMREVQHLSKYASEVVVIHRRSDLRAQEALQQLVKSKSNVSFVWNSEVIEVLGDTKVSGVKVNNNQTNQQSELELDGLFIAIGHKPNTQFLTGQIALDSAGYIQIHDQVFSSKQGVFVAGDVSDYKYRQAVTAAGSGTQAALEAEKYLEER